MFGLHGLSNPAHDPDLKTTGGLLYYQYDGMRSVSEVTDRHGDIIEQYRYDAFGNIFTGTTNSYNFNGYTNMHYDWKTGLVNLNARWYNPGAGRFMSEDTYPGNMYQSQTLNRYSYVMNNPVNYWDPTGNVAEGLYPGGGTELPNWVRNNETKTITQEFESYAHLDTWSPVRGPEVKFGETTLVNKIQETRGYRQIYNQTQTTSWYYEYSRLTHHFDGAYAEPGGTHGPFTFQETKKLEWEDFLSAEEVSKQNQQEIATYGAPASARIIARAVTLPQQYSKAIQNQIQKQFKKVEPPKPVTPKVEKQPSVFMKSWNSFKGIGKDFYNGLGQRADKALDGPYDFFNYLSIGVLDGVNSGAKSRNSKKLNSTENFIDYATFGISGMLKGAISPEEQFSKEHWLNIFGVVTSVLGIRGVTNTPSSSTSKTKNSGTTQANENIVYRALNQKDADRLSQGLGLEAKNPNGTWKLDEHIVGGSGRASWVNDPFISTTIDIDIARWFNQLGSNLGIVKIDLNKVPSQVLKGYEIYPRLNGVEGLPYHYSIWQQEISIHQSIPIEAIKGFVK